MRGIANLTRTSIGLSLTHKPEILFNPLKYHLNKASRPVTSQSNHTIGRYYSIEGNHYRRR